MKSVIFRFLATTLSIVLALTIFVQNGAWAVSRDPGDGVHSGNAFGPPGTVEIRNNSEDVRSAIERDPQLRELQRKRDEAARSEFENHPRTRAEREELSRENAAGERMERNQREKRNDV